MEALVNSTFSTLITANGLIIGRNAVLETEGFGRSWLPLTTTTTSSSSKARARSSASQIGKASLNGGAAVSPEFFPIEEESNALATPSSRPAAGHSSSKEKLWQEFFSDPLEWWDNRAEKTNPNFPDFKHKCTKAVLWVDGWSNPPWVKAKLATMPPQSHHAQIVWTAESVGGDRAHSRGGRSAKNSIAVAYDDVRALVEIGRPQDVLRRFGERGITVTASVYKCLLRRCAQTKNLMEGREVHLHIIRTGFRPDIYVASELLKMYSKCGSMVDARRVFDVRTEPDLVMWTLMLTGYAKHGLFKEAFELYEQMRWKGVKPDRMMYTGVVSVCASLGNLDTAKAVHSNIVESGIMMDVVLESNLVHMYARCGDMKLACEVFDKMPERNIVSWSAMISGCAHNGDYDEAFELFRRMRQENVKPNGVTFVSLIKVCASLAALDRGKWMYDQIVRAGLETDVVVATALVGMFAKCGGLRDAQELFDKMKVRNIISWTAMINAYAGNGLYAEAMNTFRRMRQEGMEPDPVIYLCLLKACATKASLQEARLLHASIVAAAQDSDVRVGNGLIDMYAKCGSVTDARDVFDRMPERDVVTWSAMIAGLGQHGHGREALKLFCWMLAEGVRPDGVTFVAVLSACNHGGLVDEGLLYFRRMSKEHAIALTVEHFNCVIDLLGRAGHVDEAEDFLNKMPHVPEAATWGALLGACRIHGRHVKLAEHAARYLLELESDDSAAVYVLLSHVYAAAGLWDEAVSLGKLMEERGVITKD